MKIERNKLAAICLLLVLTIVSRSQMGGDFALTQTAIASGGGTNANGGSFRIDGTFGQFLVGTNHSGGSFSLQNGFWTGALAPTAASAAIGGRIGSQGGEGIGNIIVVLTNASTGAISSARSGSFGYYRFDGLTVGQTYILTVVSKRFQFEPEARVITLLNSLDEEDFTVVPQ